MALKCELIWTQHTAHTKKCYVNAKQLAVSSKQSEFNSMWRTVFFSPPSSPSSSSVSPLCLLRLRLRFYSLCHAIILKKKNVTTSFANESLSQSTRFLLYAKIACVWTHRANTHTHTIFIVSLAVRNYFIIIYTCESSLALVSSSSWSSSCRLPIANLCVSSSRRWLVPPLLLSCYYTHIIIAVAHAIGFNDRIGDAVDHTS